MFKVETVEGCFDYIDAEVDRIISHQGVWGDRVTAYHLGSLVTYTGMLSMYFQLHDRSDLSKRADKQRRRVQELTKRMVDLEVIISDKE